MTTRTGGPGTPFAAGVPGWPVPVALIGLCAVPLAAGTPRVGQPAGGPSAMPQDDRITASPVPILVHLIGAALYAALGALQFVPRLRRRSWHRRAGRLVALAGVMVAGSAVGMTLVYDRQPGTGPVLYALRLLLGAAMTACVVLGLVASELGHGDGRPIILTIARAQNIAVAGAGQGRAGCLAQDSTASEVS